MLESGLKRLILERLDALGMKKSELVRRLSYKNISGGINALERMMRDGQPNPFILKNLPSALEMDQAEVLAAVRAETVGRERARIDREANAFRPHLYVETELDRPAQLMFCALTGGIRQKYVDLPAGTFGLGLEEECRRLQPFIADYVRQQAGKTDFFGRILGFVYFRSYYENPAERICFDLEGRVTNELQPPIHEPQLSVLLESRDITPHLKDGLGGMAGQSATGDMDRDQSLKKPKAPTDAE